MKRIIPLLTMAVATSMLIVGCRGAVPKPVEAPPTPAELLMGLWTSREERSEGQYNLISLMFTPERFIFVVIRYDSSGAKQWARTESRTWTATDSAIHKRESYNEDDILHENILSERRYEFSDGALVVENWDRRSPSSNTDTYQRADSIPSFYGTWTRSFPLTSDDGVEEHVTRSFEITEETFIESVTISSDEIPRSWAIRGTVVEYDKDNHYFYVLVNDLELNGYEPAGAPIVGETLRWAFSPSASPRRVYVSRFPQEHRYDEETGTWQVRPDWWGDYLVEVEKPQ